MHRTFHQGGVTVLWKGPERDGSNQIG